MKTINKVTTVIIDGKTFTTDGIIKRTAKLLLQRKSYAIDNPYSYAGFLWQRAFEKEMSKAGENAIQLYFEAKEFNKANQ